jgi:hypothetical protein
MKDGRRQTRVAGLIAHAGESTDPGRVVDAGGRIGYESGLPW